MDGNSKSRTKSEKLKIAGLMCWCIAVIAVSILVSINQKPFFPSEEALNRCIGVMNRYVGKLSSRNAETSETIDNLDAPEVQETTDGSMNFEAYEKFNSAGALITSETLEELEGMQITFSKNKIIVKNVETNVEFIWERNEYGDSYRSNMDAWLYIGFFASKVAIFLTIALPLSFISLAVWLMIDDEKEKRQEKKKQKHNKESINDEQEGEIQ